MSRKTWVGTNLFYSGIKQTRMKKDLEIFKSIKGMGEDLPSKPLPPGTLYVVCLNKPLIDLWKVNNRQTNGYYESSESNMSWDYASQKSSFPKDDRILGMLSPEEEMLLFNDGLSDNY